ncbi:putative PEP-binding protein [Yinghuangia soli]|uniref:Phosphoenolpyruvate-protein phosphotransferase n=1 Tax=Yinghuangia soli TaxID=2908204 RepID=A0AA41U0D8_9ACTN|nr:putative PEP-binding protein [Yinghuangia soli]MCF2528315.1 phosphoenolpyruvate--protein phosphotransferase [Yinghuangia soli]
MTDDAPADTAGSAAVLHGIAAAGGVAVGRVLSVDDGDAVLAQAPPGTPGQAADAARGAAPGAAPTPTHDSAPVVPGPVADPVARATPDPTPDAGHDANGPRPTGSSGTGVDAALAAVASELTALADALRSQGRSEQADIVEVGALIAEDPALAGLAAELAASGLTAAEAVAAAANRHADALAALGDPLFADRAADIRQIGRRAAGWLHGLPSPAARDGAVLVGTELAAADILAPGGGPVAAVSERGGPTGHLAVVARALGIPLVLGADVGALRGAGTQRVLVDGDRGLVVLDPVVRDVVPDFSVSRDQAGSAQDAEVRPVATRDGHRVCVYANVGGHREAVAARTLGAEGVGLLRTELPFLAADHWPDAEEHAAALAPLLRDGPDGPVTVRTLDFAADKRPPFLTRAPYGPGAPIGPGGPDDPGDPGDPGDARSDTLLRTQFHGILTAAATASRPVRIMVPMVADAADFARCRRVLTGVCHRLGVPAPQFGAMVELPGAVADADALAAAADFLSLGTNDLTAALLGLARDDPRLTPDRAAEPAVLHAVRRVAECAHARGLPVSVCGDAAADPRVLPLLVGLGIDALSVAPPALERVREQVRALDRVRCAELVRERLAAPRA